MNGFTIIVSIVKVPVSPEGCSTFGNASLQESFAPGQPISRILSNRRVSKKDGSCLGGHLSRLIVTYQLMQPTRSSRETSRFPIAWAMIAPAWPCSAWGIPGSRIAADPGGLLHHLFTCTPEGVVCFCGPAPRVTPPGCYPACCPMECGLSSTL